MLQPLPHIHPACFLNRDVASVSILNSAETPIFQQPLSIAGINVTHPQILVDRCTASTPRVVELEDMPARFELLLDLKGNTVPTKASRVMIGDGRNAPYVVTLETAGQTSPTLGYALNPALPFTMGNVCQFQITFKPGQVW